MAKGFTNHRAAFGQQAQVPQGILVEIFKSGGDSDDGQAFRGITLIQGDCLWQGIKETARAVYLEYFQQNHPAM